MLIYKKDNFTNSLLFFFIIFNYYIYHLTNIYFYASFFLLIIYLNYKIIINFNFKFDYKSVGSVSFAILFIIGNLYAIFFLVTLNNYEINFDKLITSNLFKEISLIYLIIFFYLLIESKKIEINYFIKFINFSFLLSIFLYDLTIVDVFFIKSTNLQINLNEWGRPLIHLSFFQDYVASKLQHAFIFFILFSYFVFDYITQKNSFIKNLIIAHAIFLIFLINSKIYYAVFFIYIFQVIIFNLTKENIKKIFQTLILLIIILVSFSYFVNKSIEFKESKYKFSIINNIKLKFFYELKFLGIINKDELNFNPIIDYLSRNVSNNLQLKKNLVNKEKFLYYFNSSTERKIISDFCYLNKGLLFQKNQKIFDKDFFLDLKKNNSSLFNKYKKIKESGLNINCESSFKNLIFYIGYLAYLFLFLFLISYLYTIWTTKNYFLLFHFVPIVILLNFHHIFFNLALVLLIAKPKIYFQNEVIR